MMTIHCPRATARRPKTAIAQVRFALTLVGALWLALCAAASAKPPASHGASTAPAPQAATASSSGNKPDAPKATAATVDVSNVSIESVTQQLQQLQSTSDSSAPSRAKLIELYQQSLADLKQADEQKTRGAEFDRQRIATPYQLELRKREGQPPAAAVQSLPADTSLADWEQRLAPAEQELEAAQKDLDAREDQSPRRAQRRVEIPKAIAAARLQLDEIEQSGQADSTPGGSPALVDARRIALEARRRALSAEISTLEKELQTYDAASAELLKLDCDVAARKVADLKQRVTAWRDAVNERRRGEADHQASEAHWAAVTAEPAARQLADENSGLAEQRQQVADLMKALADDAESVQERLNKVSDEFKDIQEKVNVAGLTDAVGQMLRKQRSELVAIQSDRQSIRRRQEEVARVQVQLFDLEDQLADLHDVDARARKIGANLATDSQAKTDDLKSLLKTRRKYLDELLKDVNSYFKGLVDLDSKQQELLSQADQYRRYIDERVLWIRSTHPLSWADVPKAVQATAWITSPAHWWEALCKCAAQVNSNPLVIALAALLAAMYFWVRPQLRRILLGGAAATPPGGRRFYHFTLNKLWQSVLATLVMAAPVPALLWLAGWLCFPLHAPDTDNFCAALAGALARIAGLSLPLLIVRNICCPGGLAETHFRWPTEAIAKLRRELGWLMALGLPLVMAVAMLDAQSNDGWTDSLGRILFIASQFLLCAFFFTSLRPPSGALHQLLVLRRGSWTERLANPAFIVLVMVPLALSALASMGYFYTALRLSSRLQSTLWLVLALVVSNVSLSRWLQAMYRRLAIQAALRAAGAPAAKRSAQPVPNAAQQTASAEPPPEIDLEKVDAQTHSLLHSIAVLGLAIGLCMVWIDVLPALRVFDQVTMWIDGDHSISLTNLLEAGVVLVMTVVAARNLPGLLEVAILQLLPLDNGVRYALTTVTRYLIVILGLAFGAGAVGIGWPKVQWLAAAITFGLGFGLQEIFANFIAGLIVLVERPIRVGDTVTVGDVTGVVSRIRMRATTILDADRKELIVPNKEFITAKLVNWTLSDSITRLVVRLGIAYGCDTQQVQQLLMRAASETPAVLKNPGPKAVFMGFSEKWMDFEVRVFVGNVDMLLSTRHQLNVAIDRAFRTAGVQLAVPQPIAPGLSDCTATMASGAEPQLSIADKPPASSSQKAA